MVILQISEYFCENISFMLGLERWLIMKDSPYAVQVGKCIKLVTRISQLIDNWLALTYLLLTYLTIRSTIYNFNDN